MQTLVAAHLASNSLRRFLTASPVMRRVASFSLGAGVNSRGEREGETRGK